MTFFRPWLCLSYFSCVSENLVVFFRPQLCFSDLSCVSEDTPELTEVSDMRIFKLLTALNPSKACGPDEIPN